MARASVSEVLCVRSAKIKGISLDLRDKHELKKIDQTVGRNIKRLRIARKMNQKTLAERVGVTFQQIQKYESGVNRVSASRLYSLAMVFGLPVRALFSDLECPGGDLSEHGLSISSISLALMIEEIQDESVKGYLIALARKMTQVS